MSPPTSGSPWREVEDGGAVIAGDCIPAGYDVGCCLYAVHHNEDYFPDSYTFSPERWLQGESTVSNEWRALAIKSFKPFSLGPRSCAGRSMALLELSLTIAKLLWSLDFRRAEGASGELGEGKPEATNGRHRPKEYQLTTHIASSGTGPRLEFRPRRIEVVGHSSLSDRSPYLQNWEFRSCIHLSPQVHSTSSSSSLKHPTSFGETIHRKQTRRGKAKSDSSRLSQRNISNSFDHKPSSTHILNCLLQCNSSKVKLCSQVPRSL